MLKIPDGIKKYLKGEDLLHIACADYLKLKYPKVLWAHPPMEGRRPGYIAQFKMKRMGGSAGVPDFVFYEPRNGKPGMALEAKHGRNKPTDSQKMWLKELSDRGYITGVFYTFDEFKKIVDNYFKD